MKLQNALALMAGTVAALVPTAASAQSDEVRTPAFQIGVTYKSDLVGVDAGERGSDVAYVDRAELTVAADFEKALGWHGATAFVHAFNTFGGNPKATAGTFLPINDIEVGGPDLKLFQAWFQQSFADGRLSVRAGQYDVNSEFRPKPAGTQFISPAFYVGSEIAATGPSGPSIFPRTDLAVRVRYAAGGNYGQFAVVRVPEGTVDRGGPRPLLFIAEAGHQGPSALSVGAWTYSRRQPGFALSGTSAEADRAVSHGAYVMAEQDLTGTPDRPGYWRAFLRAGVSDGDTTPFESSVQVGLSGRGLVKARPESTLSIGYVMAGLSDRYRRPDPAGEPAFAPSEGLFELNYSDRVLPFLTLQPDFQYVARPMGRRDADGVVILSLRAVVQWQTR